MEEMINCVYTGSSRVEITKEGVKDMLHTAHDGDGQYVTPGDMLAGALGACTLTMMSVVADRFNQKLDGAKIAINPVFDQNGGGLKEIHMHITLPQDASEEMRRRYLAVVNTCPVHRSLNPDIKFTVHHN